MAPFSLQHICNQIGIHPADHTGIDISNLEKGVGPGVTGTAIAVKYQAHPPILFMRFTGHRVMAHDHGHAWLEVEEQRPLGMSWQAMMRGMINRHWTTTPALEW